MTQIRDRTVVVTGAASGIGRLLSIGMARLGGDVALLDLDEDAAARLAKALEAEGLTARAYACDVTDSGVVSDVAAAVRADLGPAHVLVNNAGVVSGTPLLDTPDAQIVKTFEVNTLALYWMTKAFLPDMVAQGSGHVVTMASAAGLIGVARQTDYAASKWAAVGFDESLRMELRQQAPGVMTTVVCPYYVDTGMFEGVETRWPWLLPILRPEQVASATVGAILHNRRRVHLPPIVATLHLLRTLPVELFDATADLLGVNASMDRFKGRARAADQVTGTS